MNEYRSVNYYDLCRLCAATQGTKLNLYSEDAKKQELVNKIGECLPVRVDEKDKLPKSICELCVQQLHQISEYRQKCINTQTMLEGCLGTNKFKNEGRVYIKDEASKGGSKPATNIVTVRNTIVKPLLPVTATQTQHVQAQTQQVQQLDPNTMTISSGNDYLSSIVQSLDDGTEVVNTPQYTFTIKEIPQQTLNDQQRLQTYSQVDEFLKPKTENKPQYNLVLNQNQITTSMSPVSPQVKQVLNTSAPFMLATNQQQQGKYQLQDVKVVQTPQSKQPHLQQQQQQCLIMKDNSNQYIQLKLQPQIDGQTYYQLTPATPTQNQTFQATGAGKVMNSVGTPIQLTTLTNATAGSTKSSPTMITIQDTPGKGQTATQITPVGRIASTTITRKTPLVLKPDGSSQIGQVKYITASSIGATNMVQSSPIYVQSTSSAANNGATQIKEVNKGTPRTIVVDGKTMKLITVQSSPKTVSLTTPKIEPMQTATVLNSAANDDDLETLEMDIQLVSVGLKPTCDICQKEFKRKEHLAQHMKLHVGVRPFKCEICEKAFNRKEHLLRHKTSHTGAKSFKCEYCQKMFSRKDNLNKHKRKHTGEGGDELDDSGKKYKLEEVEEVG